MATIELTICWGEKGKKEKQQVTMDYEMVVRELWRCGGCVPKKKMAKQEANLDYEMATRGLTICWGKKKGKARGDDGI